MTTQFRVIRAMALAMALSAPMASVALADSPANPQSGSSIGKVAQAPSVVPNNGLCNAQFGVPMADCDTPQAKHAISSQPGRVDYQGFPYNLSTGG
jgi:hypothetical protein